MLIDDIQLRASLPSTEKKTWKIFTCAYVWGRRCTMYELVEVFSGADQATVISVEGTEFSLKKDMGSQIAREDNVDLFF